MKATTSFSFALVALYATFASPWCSAFVGNRHPRFGTSLVSSTVSGTTTRIPPSNRGSQGRDLFIGKSCFRPPSTNLLAISELATVSNLAQSLLRNHGSVPLWQAFGLNAFLFGVFRTKLLKVLTPEGFAHALALGTLTWTTLGWKGWTVCVLYLVLGSTVTKVKFAEKEKRGIAEGRGGRRGPENVWGSAATGLACAACAAQGTSLMGIPSGLYVLGFVASFATKLSDTFASEIGKAYGKTTFLITTLERVEPGTEGAVSAEGTAASVVGGASLSIYAWLIGMISAPAVPISILAAFIATNIESLLGATLQGKDNLKWLTNDVVNFFNTLIGAIIAILAGMAFL